MPDFPLALLNADYGSFLGGALLVTYAAITSLRKRRDVSITELLKRIAELEAEADKRQARHEQETARVDAEHAREVARLEADLEDRDRDLAAMAARLEVERTAQYASNRDLHHIRLTLSQHGIPDPTQP